MWQITFRELKDRKWSLLAYCLGSLLLLWIYAATFKSSQASAQQLLEVVKGYPKGFLDAFGLNNLASNSIEVYLNAKHFSFIWPLLAIILALSRAGSQFAGEIQAGTMGLLLALPLKRWQIFIAKYATGLLTIVVFTLISVFGIIPLASAYDIPTHFHVLVGAWVLTTLFMGTVYAVSVVVSAWVSDKGRVYAIVSAVLMLTYVANIIALLDDKLSGLKYYSLFYYFNTAEVLDTGHITTRSLAVFGLTIVIATVVAAWRFSRRDISV
jgi:ABC-2 type transport system permease protein